MEEKFIEVESGKITYWVEKKDKNYLYTLVFLHGIGSDHTSFDSQIDVFRNKFNILVWDNPGNGKSKPFDISYSLNDLARWLKMIIEDEDIKRVVLVGHSLGGYVAQAYNNLFGEEVEGIILLGSGPLKNGYLSSKEMTTYRLAYYILRFIPWPFLSRLVLKTVCVSRGGKRKSKRIFDSYKHDKNYFKQLVGHCHKILVDATEMAEDKEIDCPLLVMYGDRDMEVCKRQAKMWHTREHIRVEIITHAAHYSQIDNPIKVNELILFAVDRIKYYKITEIDYFASHGHDL